MVVVNPDVTLLGAAAHAAGRLADVREASGAEVVA
jgi:hypothetical protein